jgi:hypothetical protein
MYLAEIIEVAIGLVFVFVIMSTACSSAQEMLANLLKWRARDLERAIRGMLQATSEERNTNDKTITQLLTEHPLITSLCKPEDADSVSVKTMDRVFTVLRTVRVPLGDTHWPSYIPARSFALSLLDIATTAGTNKSVIQASLKTIQKKIPKPDRVTKQDLKNLLEKAELLGDTVELENEEALALMAEVKAFAAAHLPPEALKETETIMTEAALQAGLYVIQQESPDLHKALDSLFNKTSLRVAKAEATLASARESVETWFNDTMDRVSGWYKRSALKVMFAAGLILSIAFNVDAIEIGKALWLQPVLRAAVVAQAESFALPAPSEGDSQEEGTQQNTDAVTEIQTLMDQLKEYQLPIGWPIEKLTSSWEYILKGLGWIITAAAASQGAPFWYDLLQKLVNLRAAGKRPPEPEAAG